MIRDAAGGLKRGGSLRRHRILGPPGPPGPPGPLASRRSRPLIVSAWTLRVFE